MIGRRAPEHPAARARSFPAFIVLACCLVGPARLVHAADADPPGNRIEIGFEERVRTENGENLIDFDDRTIDLGDVRHHVRFRTRAWAKLNAGGKAELMLGVNHESRRITTPDTPFEWDETIFETLYLDLRLHDRLSVRVGRQDISRGDGFVIADGGPLDGSRSYYLNALVVSWTPGKSKLELFAVFDPGRDICLPLIHDKKKFLIEWDERAVGLYFTEGGVPGTDLQGYYFFKTETDDVRPASSPAFQPDRRLHTLGGRVVRDLGSGWSAQGELAGQVGEQDPAGGGVGFGGPWPHRYGDIRAWGGGASVKKTFAHASKPSVSLAYIGLSGDDPQTADVEGWDPLFSRWPKWSELYIYTLGTEKGPAYWTNVGMWQGEFLIAPVKPLRIGGGRRFPDGA